MGAYSYTSNLKSEDPRFCDNPLCDLYEFPKSPQTQVLKNNKILTISSHTVRGVNLCACCLNAIKIGVTHNEHE